MKILISGFEPFLNIKENPSQILVSELKKDYQNFNSTTSDSIDPSINSLLLDQLFSSIQLESVILPVEYEQAFVALKKVIDQFKPDLVLSIGVAADRDEVCLERIAINYKSTNLTDNSGVKPRESKIHSTGPDGVFSNLDVEALVNLTNEKCQTHAYYNGSNQEDIMFKVSNTAGIYVCNALMYYLFLDGKMNSYLAGFLHIPNQTDSIAIKKIKNLVLNLLASVPQKS